MVQLEIVDISSSGEHSGITQGAVGAVAVSAVVMDIALELRESTDSISNHVGN